MASFGSRSSTTSAACDFFSFSSHSYLDRVEALLVDVRLLGAGDDDQGAAARGDSAVFESGMFEEETGWG